MNFLHCGVLAACLAYSASAFADGYRSVRVELKEGDAVEIQLSGRLITKFVDGNTSFADNAGTAVDIPSANIARFTFLERDAQSSIDEVTMPRVDGGIIHFSALPCGSVISVSDTAGRIVFTRTVEGDFTLSLKQFTPGIYVVSANGVTYKVKTR